MKKFLFVLLTSCFLFFFENVSAQDQKLVADCYTSYKKRGDSYVSFRNYDLAVKEYQAAQLCNISIKQKKELDSLIADIAKRRQLEMKKTVIIKRY
jgi:hypothetical protein